MSEHRIDSQPEYGVGSAASGQQRQDSAANFQSGTPIPVLCWRCGKQVEPDNEVCCHCRASLLRERGPVASVSPRDAETLPPVKLIWVFSLLLLVSLFYGWAVHFCWPPQALYRGRQELQREIAWTLVVEAVDVALLGLALLWIGPPAGLPRPSWSRRTAAWLAATPLLVLLLVVNVGYHRVLQDLFFMPNPERDLDVTEGLLGWFVLIFCVQPALLEEFFFRYLALGVLREWTGTHTAVLISAVMFGMAHVFAPLSIPLFVAIGLALGYLRVASGSLVLPIVLHFGHNAAILWSQFSS
jgi:CAAX protease family protein